MRMKLFVIFYVLVCTNAQVDRDMSFQEMCTFWGGEGTYQPRDGGFNSASGDKCTFSFPISTADQDSARKYCEENVPFHINGVTSGNPTTCQAEATLICKSGWVQMFGRCYQIHKELKTREAAVDHCKAQDGSTIAFMHREALPFRFKDYFTFVSRIWIDASEAITNNLLYDKPNGYLLLAFDGYKYNLPNIALARVDRSETAMVLCEYTPSMNLAESNYLLKRYGDVYYPTIFTEKTSYVRTSSTLQRNDADHMGDNNYCKKVLRPFLQSDNSQSAVPTREFLDKLTKQREAKIIRTSVYSGDAKKDSRTHESCTSSQAKNYGIDYPNGGFLSSKYFFKSLKDDPIWRFNEPDEQCDGATWSTGVVLSRDSDKGLEAMSDARYAPIYCQTRFETMEYGDCPQGWTTYMRKERGQKWCHYFSGKNVKASYDGAEQECRKMDAHITGFTNGEELDLLDKMLDKSGAKFENYNSIWIGARRRELCTTLGTTGMTNGFDPDETSGCSRLRVFEWVNGVAPNPPDFLSRWMADFEPNYVGTGEKCVELLKGTQARGGWSTAINGGDKKINDVVCHYEKYYFCGKEAPIVAKKTT